MIPCKKIEANTDFDISQYLSNFKFEKDYNLFRNESNTTFEMIVIDGISIVKYINEYWTSKQRQANSIHEISYRACFKPQLPRFFIELLTKEGDIVYDPFAGRGTTVLEAALLNRNIISNDINPISTILTRPRLFIPDINELKERLDTIQVNKNLKSDIDLSMFFHEETLSEILSIRQYLIDRKNKNLNDNLDEWIKMVSTNRLTGHSSGFFSAYTLPPNQAVSPERQIKINSQRNSEPEYRNTKEIILKKTKSLIRNLDSEKNARLKKIGDQSLFLNEDARNTKQINNDSVTLTVTSPPFLDVVQYVSDNWMRCWFNNINEEAISKKITMSKKIEDWNNVMNEVFKELFRITKPNGYVAFEVGEIRNGKIKLDEYVVKLGVNNGFICIGIMINEQTFTKTANIWGISNNGKGTNTNRIVIFQQIFKL